MLIFIYYNLFPYKLLCIIFLQLKVTKPNGQSFHPDKLKTLQVSTTTKYGFAIGNVTKTTYTPSPEGTIVIRCDVPRHAKTVSIEVSYTSCKIILYFSVSWKNCKHV